ncbi:hypothetical protein JRQ81_011572 [Phrynocephalus forsythii]|uniref:Uncharacterized protein n=1 Tax=Phrynocephalus forsythii TaxID=171643 RepID=A0A9Q0X638_9SAUR|nr:hypothetical protein JRQ81_011572 [Phrynocephalus forsythii]
MDMLDPGLDTATASAASSHEKGHEVEEGVELQEGDGANADEQTAVAITSVQQAAFTDHNIQYQFRTENNGGQVTYRVVQVTDSQLDGQTDATGAVSVVSTAAFTSGQQAVAQEPQCLQSSGKKGVLHLGQEVARWPLGSQDQLYVALDPQYGERILVKTTSTEQTVLWVRVMTTTVSQAD